jgi:hypothetical protein
MADALTPTTESRKSRLQILRERQKKLRESYKSQIDISRLTLNTDADATGSTDTPDLQTRTPTAPKAVTPSPEATDAAMTPNTAFLKLKHDNEELKRQVVELQADRELLLQKQMDRFQSASEQLNEMEELLEDYRCIAEESEENNAVLKAKNSLLISENETLKKDNEALSTRVDKQQERIDGSVEAMNDLEQDLMKSQDELDLSDQTIRTLEHQLRNLTTSAFATQHSGTTYYPQQPTYYQMPGSQQQKQQQSVQRPQQHNFQLDPKQPPFTIGGGRGGQSSFQQFGNNQGGGRGQGNGRNKKKRR